MEEIGDDAGSASINAEIEGEEKVVIKSIASDLKSALPETFALYQNYPNPFNPSTRIQYDLPVKDYVTLKVYNTLGQEVATIVDENSEGGRYEVEWNALGIASGVYLYKLQARDFVDTKRLLLLK